MTHLSKNELCFFFLITIPVKQNIGWQGGTMESWAKGLTKDPKYHDHGSTGGRPATDRPCRPTVPTGLSDHRRRGTMKPLAYRLPDHGLIMVRLTDNRPRRGLPGRPGLWVNWMRWPTSSMGTQPAPGSPRSWTHHRAN